MLMVLLTFSALIPIIGCRVESDAERQQKDKAAQANCVVILTIFLYALDKAVEDGTTDVTSANNIDKFIVGTGANDSKIPELWWEKNPWNNRENAYKWHNVKQVTFQNLDKIMEDMGKESPLGQVQICFFEDPKNKNLAVGSAVKLTYKNVFVKIQGLR